VKRKDLIKDKLDVKVIS